ncbi:MAG TPA: 2-phospho-L-lactate transferase [Propionibacteriaceae bacterium]|nr:2-phospho-L-lactate transferase [Propionibacteriaceae bacterium]
MAHACSLARAEWNTGAVRIVILAGGVGGSKFVLGVRRAYPTAEVTVIVNTADDITLHGLRICPDLDTIMYTLGGGGDPARGWGREDESWRVMEELTSYGVEPTWFSLGDRDVGTHLVRTQMLNAGCPLSEVTSALCGRWLAHQPRLRLLPMTDDRVETHVTIADPDALGQRRAVHFQEYWVRLQARPEVLAITLVGMESARPAPGVIEAIQEADLILVAPSNPVVSIGPILAVPELREAVRRASASVVGFAGILGGSPVLGMAHRLLPAIGVDVDAAAVGLHYGARSRGGVLDAWTMDSADASSAERVQQAGLRAVVTDLMMRDPASTAAFVSYAIKSATS